MVTMRGRGVCGFTYLSALFLVALMGAGLALMSELWHTASLREKEAELLYVGNQYRHAIERYYLSGQRQYPRTLQDLLKDPRTPSIQRHLRKLYPDPVAGTSEWMLVKGPDGGIMGVHSASQERPFKIANFKLRDRDFEGATKYADWKFVSASAAQAQTKPPGAPGSTPSLPPGVSLPPTGVTP